MRQLEIYNVNGQKIISFPEQEFPEGIHQVIWNGCNQSGQVVSPGIYFYRLVNGSGQNIVSTGRIIKLQSIR